MADKIILGHSNMDLDCFGSISLARYLYPDHVPVRSGRVHPIAKNLYTIYRSHLGMIAAKELKGRDIEEVVIVDTRQYDRVKEYFSRMPDFSGNIVIYDHHLSDCSDFPDAEVHEAEYGSNTTLICLELARREMAIHENDATIGLAGIYADTGNFTHPNVCEEDFAAAAYLMKYGASLSAVRKLLSKLREEHQVSLFHELLNQIEFHSIHGYSIATSYMKLEGQMGGLAAVVEQVFEVEDTDAYVAVFELEKDDAHLIIGRASDIRIDLNIVMNAFGGAGHPQAASALVKKSAGFPIYRHVINHLDQLLNYAMTGVEIMREAVTVPAVSNLLQAALHLEETNNSGAPVVDEEGHLVGMITLRDIQKGRRANQIQAPVHAYMTRNVVHATGSTTIREIEKLFYTHDIGHLPIVEDGMVRGMVTRSDYIRFLHKGPGELELLSR